MERSVRTLGLSIAPVLLFAWCGEASPLPGPAAAPSITPAAPAADCTASPASSPPPGAFFQERFDDGCLSKRGWYDNTAVVLSGAEHAPGSAKAAQFHFTPGATTPTSGGALRHKFTPSASMYVSYFVKYGANWVGSGKPYHPHEFYALSSMDGDWDGLSNDWLTLYVETNFQGEGGAPRLALQDNKAINSLLGALPLSLIGLTENRSTGGCNGVVEAGMVVECYNAPPWYNDKQLRGPVVFQSDPGPGYKGNWNFVEAYFQLNSVSDGVAKSDGVMQYWFNGTPVIDRHDIQFRTGARGSLQLAQFVIAPYIGDGSPADQSMYIDDLTVAGARVTTSQRRERHP